MINLENIDQLSVWIFPAVFTGGVLSSMSPCTLGILPIVVGYIGGYSESTTRKTVFQLLFFILGLSLVLTVLGITAAFTGKTLGFHTNPYLGLILASLILIMGLVILEIIEIPLPVLIKQMPANNNNAVLYPIMLGGAFALASTPCATPVLAGIMAYASFKSNLMQGGLLLFFYALGQSLIILCVGLFATSFKKMNAIRSYSNAINKISGVLLILASAFLYLTIFELI